MSRPGIPGGRQDLRPLRREIRELAYCKTLGRRRCNLGFLSANHSCFSPFSWRKHGSGRALRDEFLDHLRRAYSDLSGTALLPSSLAIIGKRESS